MSKLRIARRYGWWPALSLSLLAAGCAAGSAQGGGDHGHDMHHHASPDEVSAFREAKPVFERYCTGCHGSNGNPEAKEHLDMTGYPFGGHHAADIGAVVKKSLGASGTPATMPKKNPGIVRGADLDKILAWVEAFERARSNETSNPHGDDHGHGHDHAH